MTRLLAAVLLILMAPGQAHAREPLPVEKESQTESPKAAKIFNAAHTILENGLEVVVIPNHRAPVVTQMLWYKVGKADEDWGKSGIAHFLEHLMFKGSEGLKPGEFSEKIRALGGNDNAFTGYDYTAYHQSVASEHLETIMKMEAGRMRGMTLPADQVDSERLVIMEERRQRTDNDPRAKFAEQLSVSLFVNHPYGIPIIGWAHEIEGLTREDAKAFYDKWYGPNNAILVISGDVEPQKVFDLAKKIYGPLPRVEVPERKRNAVPPMNSVAQVTLEHEAIREPVAQILYRAPNYRNNKEESLALQVLEEIMGGGSTSRLYKSLAVEQKIVSGAGMSYNADSWDESSLWLYASPLPGKTLDEVTKALQDELRKVAASGVTPEEMNDAKSRMQDSAVYALDSLTGPAMIFGHGLTTGSSLDDIEHWIALISQVTAEQVHAVAKKYLDPDNYGTRPPVFGYLVPPAPKEEQTPTAEAPAEEKKP